LDDGPLLRDRAGTITWERDESGYVTGRSDDEMVAYALEIEPALLAFVPELLADLEVLGADVDTIVEALGEVGISDQSTVVDLGCGKGGVAIAAAAALGCRVIGVDLFAPFIDVARAAAERAGVGELCQFLQAGIGVGRNDRAG
jgi:methylase of polypeptide subunit release factors